MRHYLSLPRSREKSGKERHARLHCRSDAAPMPDNVPIDAA